MSRPFRVTLPPVLNDECKSALRHTCNRGRWLALPICALLAALGAGNIAAQNGPVFATSPEDPALRAIDPHWRYIDPLGKLNPKRLNAPRSPSSAATAYLAPFSLPVDSLSQRISSIAAAAANNPTEVSHADGQREKTFARAAAASRVSDLASASRLTDMELLKSRIKEPEGLQLVRGRHGTPTYIRAADLTPTGLLAVSQFGRAQGFLGAIRDVLGLKNPDAELELRSVSVSELGKTRFRFRQTFRGIPVYAQELSVYVKQTGEVNTLRGNFRATPRLTVTTPTLSPDDAREIVEALYRKPVRFHEIQLVILPDEDSDDAKLAWRVESYIGFAEGWHYFIDALSGSVLQRIPAIQQGAVSASGADLTATTRNFTAWQSGSAFYMIDVTRPIDDVAIANPMIAPDANGNLVVRDCNLADPEANPCNYEQSISAISGWAAAAVSALWNVYQTLDYFKNTHQRNSYDGQGGTINIFVNAGGGTTDNAFWDFSTNRMVFGAGSGNLFSNLAKALDVTAHEFTHGVISTTANLQYMGQSGALNESFADFFGAMVDRNWTSAENVTLASPGYLRNMADPHSGRLQCGTTQFAQPAHMSEYQYMPNTQAGDWGGVHCNSGIPNRAAYLIADGLSIEGLGVSIGKASTERIYYYALENYLHESSQFVDARRALVDAAAALFGAGSTAEAAVQTAWDLVGVSDPTQTTTSARLPTDADRVIGPDYLIYRLPDGSLYIETGFGPLGPLNLYPATAVRPAVYFDSAAGTGYALYANASTGSMRLINLSTFADALIKTGNFHAFAISPDGNTLAYINSSRDSNIYVTQDLITDTPWPIRPLNSEGNPVSAYVIPDSIAFDYRGEQIIFDFAVPQASPSGATYYYWTIGVLNLYARTMDTTTESQPVTVSVGNPVFASNNNYVFAFDYVDTTTNASAVYLYNSNRPELTFVVNPDLNLQNRQTLGHPVFDGDDSSVIVQTRYTYCPFLCTDYDPYYLYRVPITKTNGKWEGNPASAVAISSYLGGFPQWYRAGSRSISATLGVSLTSVNFGTVTIGSAKNETLTLTNTGNVDVYVSDLTISGADFKHDGFSGLIPRGQAVAVLLSFQPTGTVGARNGSLTIMSDATAVPPTVGLSGYASAPPDTQAPTVPSGLTATAVSGSQINLSWTASTDNVGVTQYKIYRGGTLWVTLGNVTSYSDTGLAASTSYSYTVAACDAAGNCSAQSAAASATTQAAPDTQAPTVPTGLTASAVSGSQINLAWTASTDNVGVALYQVFRGGVFRTTVNAPTVSYSDTGLTASTTYSYSVQACDAAGNCSAQSSSAAATTSAAGSSSHTANLEQGFNLIGNSLNITLDVVAIFGNQDSPTGITSNVVSIWKWNAVDGRWAFHSPQLTAAGNASYASSKGYEVLSTINPGEGYWVNVIGAMTLPAQTGSAFNWNGFNFVNLTTGFNLISHASNVTPSQFNNNVSATPPSPGAVPTDNFVSLWAWDAVAGNWYFYSPLLEYSGGLAAVKSYADTHFFRHFQDYNKTLGIGTGFWVNRP